MPKEKKKKSQKEVINEIVKLLNENDLTLEVKPEYNVLIVPKKDKNEDK